jgi:hypothetical protein
LAGACLPMPGRCTGLGWGVSTHARPVHRTWLWRVYPCPAGALDLAGASTHARPVHWTWLGRVYPCPAGALDLAGACLPMPGRCPVLAVLWWISDGAVRALLWSFSRFPGTPSHEVVTQWQLDQSHCLFTCIQNLPIKRPALFSMDIWKWITLNRRVLQEYMFFRIG